MTVFKDIFNMKNKEKMNRRELNSLTKSIYYLLKGKIGILDALSIISENYERTSRKNVLKAREKIEEGLSLEKAFAYITSDREFLELIAIGEETGNLEAVFKNLYEKYEFIEKIRKEVRNLSLYPLTVVVTAIIIVFVLLKSVVPRFIMIYSDMGQELPFLTKVVIRISGIVDRYGFIFLIIAVLSLWMIIIAGKNNRETIEKIMLRMALIGDIYREVSVLNFTRNMYSLVSAGIPLLQSLKMCSGTESLLLKKEIRRIILKIEKGETVRNSFKNLKFFNDEYRGFLVIGEKTGEMTLPFENLSNIYNDRVNEKIRLFLKLLEPLSIIFIGIVIGTIIFAVMLPIFKMGEML